MKFLTKGLWSRKQSKMLNKPAMKTFLTMKSTIWKSKAMKGSYVPTPRWQWYKWVARPAKYGGTAMAVADVK